MWKSNCLFIEKIKQNRIKNPNWQEQPVGYLQAWPGIWTWKYREEFQQVARVRLQPGTAGLRKQRDGRLATLYFTAYNPV